jgi:curved DNA-binding protein CbpA
MDPRLHGSLGESLLPDLIREIARRGASGALRLSRDRTARSIYFDVGTPVSVTSELPDEQLEYKLLKEGRTTAGLIQAARRTQPTSRLARALVDNGVVSQEAMRRTTGDLVREIVLSIFEWEEGDYEFDEGAQPTEAGVLDCTPADLISGARHAAGIERLANVIAPPEMLIAPADTTGYFLASLPALDSVESYVLSRIESPTRVSEVSDLVGLPEEETHRAVCVLVALGMLARAGHAGQAETEKKTPPNPMLEAVSRKLELFDSADYYAVLGVDKFATAGTVTRAFDELQRMFSSYRLLFYDDEELHTKLDTLFAKVAEAYQTLSDPNNRWAYDKAAAETSTNGHRSLRPPMSAPNRLQMAAQGHGPAGDSTGQRASSEEAFSFDSLIERGATPTPTRIIPGPTATPIEPLPRASTSSLQAPKRVPIHGLASASIEPASRPDQADVSPPRRAPIPNLASASIESPAAPAGIKLPEREASQQPDQPQWVTASQTALRNYNQGRTRYEQKDVNAAHHLFREACRLDPSQPHYHFYLAMTLIILSQARHEHTHSEGCHVTCSLGGALVSNPRMRYEAERHLLRAAELDPGNSQIPLRLGLLYKEAGLTKKAEHYFHETLLRDGKNKTALFELQSLREENANHLPDDNTNN